jgi:hypothetical protein
LVALLLLVILGTPILYFYAGDAVQKNWQSRLPLHGVLLAAAIMAGLGLVNTLLVLAGGLFAVPFFGRRGAHA